MFLNPFTRKLLATLALSIILVLPVACKATTVRMQTTLGPIDVVLYDTAAPRTVANFLTYVNSGAYKNSFIHRSVPGFVIQGGGFAWDDASATVVNVPVNSPVANEFSVTRSNVRGTIAMAKLGSDPNSATSQWFINLGDNAANLDTQNGGFTVFGQVTLDSMTIVDAIAQLPLANAGSPFDSLPIVGTVTSNTIEKKNLVIVSAATTASSSYQGLWWNANESGWGMSVTQHGNIIFAALYTYDAAGQPTWYVIPNCPVTNGTCSGAIYQVSGGTSPAVAWSAAGKAVAQVGTGTLTFASATAGNFSFTINNVAGSKAITLQPLATGTTAPAIDYTDLWWNPNEDGWGISLTQQYGIIFAAWYVYDATGKPVWYVVPNCPVSGAGCSGALYQVTGGKPLTGIWNGTNPASSVGSITFAFSGAGSGTMSYTLNGVTSNRAIVRQAF
jgi:cyclophilin family peptidyl-prolyl cis-trans isomerase